MADMTYFTTPHTPPQAMDIVIKSEDIEKVIREALTRYEKGKEDHGDLDLRNDKRDFIHEAEKELLDCINYCAFQILKLRSLRTKK